MLSPPWSGPHPAKQKNMTMKDSPHSNAVPMESMSIDMEDDDPPPPAKERTVALDVDYQQAALYYSTTEEQAKVLLFSTLGSASRALEKVVGFKARRSGCGDFYGRHRMLACASILVILQVSLMHQLLFSVEHRACTSSSDCVRGTSCSVYRRQRRNMNVCEGCSRLDRNETLRIQKKCFEIFDSANLLHLYETNQGPDVSVHFAEGVRFPQFERAAGRDVSYAPSVFVEFCEGCVDSDGVYKSLRSVTRENVRSMRRGDFLTLLVCGIAMGLTIVGELREIKICNIAQRRCFTKSRHHPLGHIWFASMNALRAYVLVPQVIAAVPRLVLLEGGNTVALIFNTVSVIFITELDNLLTQRILSPSTVIAINDKARVLASKEDLRYLAVTQKIFVLGVIVVIFVGLFMEIRYFEGIAYLLAVGLVFAEGLAELLFYDSEQPLLTRIILTSSNGLLNCLKCCCCWTFCCPCRILCYLCRRLFRFVRGSPAKEEEEEKEEKEETLDDDARRFRDALQAETTSHLRTVASQRQRRRTLCTGALIQDIIAYTIEFLLIAALVSALLNASLQTVY